MRNLSFYVIVAFLICGMLCTILPYPFFSDATLLTSFDREKINTFNEHEDDNLSLSKTSSPILSQMAWQDGVECLLNLGQEYEGFDLVLEAKFSFTRIGGINHADIVPSSEQAIFAATPSSQIHAVIVKLAPNLFVPASLSFNRHGYGTDDSDGHYCLHFQGSLTDGTTDRQISHEKNIIIAKKEFPKVKDSL